MTNLPDTRRFGKVAVLMGGSSSEREISLESGMAVLAALQRSGIDAHPLDFGPAAVRVLQSGEYNRIFNMLHGKGGEDGVVQGVLEVLGLPYTGSGVLASALSMDKLRTKLCWLGAGLPTPQWRVLRSLDDAQRCASELGYPLMIKPAQEGSSIGLSKVQSASQLCDAFLEGCRYHGEVFAEAWVHGIEYTGAVLNDVALPLIRLEIPLNKFFDFNAKYKDDTTRYHCPAGLSADAESRLQQLLLEACRVVGIRGWGRVDFILDEQQQPWLLEVNSVPGMTSHSLVPMAAKAAGMSFDELACRILESSVPDRQR